jgi:hypothetical protein
MALRLAQPWPKRSIFSPLKHAAVNGASRACSAHGPFGGSFRVAVAPERMVNVRHQPPFDEQQVGIKTRGRFGMVLAPGCHGPVLRLPHDPRPAGALSDAQERAACPGLRARGP